MPIRTPRRSVKSSADAAIDAPAAQLKKSAAMRARIGQPPSVGRLRLRHRMRRDGLIGIANARRFAEECDALPKIGFALVLDRGENVDHNGLDLGRTEEDRRLGD